MLPGKDGIDVCKEIRAESGVPIVMLTAKGDTVDVVVGLESGADDYVVKPFKPKELVARIRARVRRNDAPAPESLTIGDLAIDVAGHSVTRDGAPINLTPLEFDLLVCLARKPWQVFTREVLLEQVWGYRHAADTRLVNVHVQRLRSKVEHDPENPEIVRDRARRRLQGRQRRSAVSTRWPTRDWPRSAPRGPPPRPDLLAPLDPGAGRRQHRAALRRRGHRASAGSCSGRPRTACSTTGSTAVVARGGQRDQRGRAPASPPRPGTDTDAAAQQRDLVEPIIASGADPRLRRRAGRAGRRRRAGSPTAARSSPPSLDTAQRARRRSSSTSTEPGAPTAPGPTPRSRRTDGDDDVGQPRARASWSGSQVQLPGRRQHLHALLPVPARRGAARRWRWSPAPC